MAFWKKLFGKKEEEQEEIEILEEKNKEEERPKGIFASLHEKLFKTREGLFSKMKSLFSSHKIIDEEMYEELEELLIQSDIGLEMTQKIVTDLEKAVKKQGVQNPEEVYPVLKTVMEEYLIESEEEFPREEEQLQVILIVGVNSDASVRRLKGKDRPINSEKDRAEMLCGLESVDYTVLFEEDTPVSLLEELKPSIHVKGGDYKKEDLPETEIVEKHGGEVRILSFVEGKSTTNIVNKIQKK